MNLSLLSSLQSSMIRFPWKTTAQTLRLRFVNDHLPLTASSLTFTTTIALVPFITVALAVFTAFPMFSTLQTVLQKWLIDSLVPDSISRQVLGYLTQFSGKASRLGVAGVAVLFITTLTMILTIDHTLNGIWQVRRLRPLRQRVFIYWAAITLGPLLLGASLTLTSYAISASKGLVVGLPGGVQFLFSLLEFALLAGGMAAMYHFVPNTYVKWVHAWAGGLFVAAGIELAKKLLVFYLTLMPSYSVVYGAFAIAPILLIWIYVAWLIVLMGAVIAAYLPSLLAGISRRVSTHGWQFQLAVETLQKLDLAGRTDFKGLSLSQLAQSLRVDSTQLEPVLQALARLDWVGQLDELPPAVEPRYVLLADPDGTLLEPLMKLLLLELAPSTQTLWDNARWSTLTMRQALSEGV